MAVPAIVAWKEKDNVGTLLQILLYFLAFVFIIYMLYKLFGLFKDAGKHIEDVLNKAKKDLKDLNPSDAPGKFKQTAEDIWTMFTKPRTPEGNAARTRVHYGSPEYAPGNAPPVNPKTGVLKRYGQEIKPGESKTFAGATYIEKDVNNMVKDPTGSGYVTKEDALARKYGFSTYAQFNAWLAGVKAALKAEGKDPNSMSLDQIVAYGRELDKKRWQSGNYGGTFEARKPQYYKSMDEYAKIQAERWNAIAKYYINPKKLTPIGGSCASRGFIELGGGKCEDMRTGRIVPCPPGCGSAKLPQPKFPPGSKHILPVPRNPRIL